MATPLPWLLDTALRTVPLAPAIEGNAQGGDARWTYRDLAARVDALAAGFARQGVVPGDHVACWHTDRMTAGVDLLALWRCGAVACPLSTREPLSRLPELCARVAATWLVADPETEAGALPRLRRLAADPGDAPLVGARPPDAWATVMLTSGSSGEPKAVVHTYGNHVYSALGAATNMPLGPGDRWLAALPLYHVGGLAILVRCMLAGATVVVPDRETPLAVSLQRARVTHLSVVTTQLLRLLDAPETARSLSAVLLGGSAAPAPLVDQACAVGLPLHTTYGMTEMASQVTTTPPGAPREVLQTSGRVLPHRAVRIAPDGQVWVRGATRCAGYLANGVLQRPFDDTGWFATGDRGHFDAAGRLHIEGRLDNQFISGGENIQPEEVERALLKVAGIRRAVVVPVPHPVYGARPVAFVEADALDSEAIQAALVGRIARFKRPDFILPLPSSDGGMKVSRQRLQQLARDHMVRPDQ